MAAIRLADVRKSFGATEVLHGVTIDVADGEFIVILGPSGCGKSTILRIVAGLEAASAGEVFIGERPMNGVEPKDRNVAMVFQNYALYPHMSVYENMAYGLRIRGMPKAEIERRVQAAAAMLELTPLLARRPRELSGGQRQRVAMGRAIVREPAAFLFDEPLSNLDAKLRVQTRLEIQKLHRRLKTTSLFVTHDQIEAMTLAERIVVMNTGRVEQIGTPQEIYARPASTFVAGFIGSPPMNLLPATVAADGRSLALEGARLRLPEPLAALAGRSLVFGVQPEHLRLGGDAFEMEVEMVESLGADRLVHGRLGAHDVIVRAGPDAHPEIGERLPVGFEAQAANWFDPQTTKRIEL